MCEVGYASSLVDAAAQPIQIAMRALEYRAYADAKRAIDNAKRQDDIPDSKMVDQVMTIQAELMRERKQKRGK